MIYFQIFVNFRILGKNGDNYAKGKYTKLKRESWNASTLTKAAQIRKKSRFHQWISFKRIKSRLSEITLEKLGLFPFYSPNEPVSVQARSHLNP